MCAIPLLVRLMLLIQGRVACRTFTLTGHILTNHKKHMLNYKQKEGQKKLPQSPGRPK